MVPLCPRLSAEFITRHAKHVKINEKGVCKVAHLISDALCKKQYSTSNWKNQELNPKVANEEAVDWIFLADTLNFSFWSEGSEKYEVMYNGKMYTGYWSLCAAINRALQEGIPICDPNYYAKVEESTLAHILRSSSSKEIPLFKERLQILHETGEILIKQFQGSFTNCIKQCQQSSETLLGLIVSHFPSYRDEALYEGQQVSFYKRAQILIGDIWSCFEGQGLGTFHDISKITMFADYRIPQVLAFFEALEYSDDLKKKLEEGHILPNGECDEVEIRGCTISCVEQICEEIQKMKQKGTFPSDVCVNSILIDNFLWDYRREHSKEVDVIPFHKTRCIYY